MESTERTEARLGSLDTLRGIAILMVVAVHTTLAYPRLLFSYSIPLAVENFGVQLFFLVSAFTMCIMWERRSAELHRPVNFYIRRICRIAPLYWSALVLYSTINGWRPIKDVLANVFLLHSIVQSANNSVVPGGWSIGVEVAFYLVFPLFALLGSSLLLPLGLAWYIVLGIGGEALLAHKGYTAIFLYYSPLTQFPVFLIGMYAYHAALARRWTYTPTSSLIVCGWLLMAFAVRQRGLEGRPMFWLGVVMLGLLVIFVVRLKVSLFPLSTIGRISYSMYLWHFLALQALVHFIPHPGSFLPIFGATLLLTTIASVLSFNTGERWSQRLAHHLVIRSARVS